MHLPSLPGWSWFTLLLLGSLLPGFSSAAPAATESNKSGLELAAKLRSLAPPEQTEIRGWFNIQRHDQDTQKIPLVMKVILGPGYWETVYDTTATGGTPAERLIIRHYPDKPNDYLWGQGGKSPAAVPREKLATRLAGSDFTFMDLGMEFWHWPGQLLLKPERPAMKLGRTCDLLESSTGQPIGGYSRVLSYIDKESGGIISAEAFAGTKRAAKSFTVKKFKKVEGRYELQEMRMIDNKADSRTWIDFDVENGKGS
ncbi:MAG TPA: outer membrane lipoprotein-sorting protein [Candidatus Saccharimonadales bacterium]|nr:outer membrane lipoprotein-sorting protein [Candidatus Saccharimonadales bacterium]